jgi:hypothetical protein
LIKNGSAYGVPTRRAAPAKWKCKDCLRQTSFKRPRGEPLWKTETAVLLYTLGLSMNAIAKQLGVSTPSILNWIRAPAARHAARPQPEPGESVVVMELDELWHFLQKLSRLGFPPVAIETVGVMIGVGEERPATFWWSESP